ncbi:MAG: S9 family peptidase [Bacteroidetes bacterium]|nr:S9 family peptidase [Bacteroidota bacterium]NOG57393.1 S9 family peptidase [Bacteroidota bacterium]
MIQKTILLSMAAALVACGGTEKKEEKTAETRKEITVKAYPDVRKDSVVDDYFGTKISDPYRWLENDTSAETEAWVKAENEVTFDYLAQIPYRKDIAKRLTELWDYEKVGTPFKHGDYYFMYKNDGIQNQSVLYYQQGLDGEQSVLLDPNTLSEDGTASINGMGFSKDGKMMAYGISRAGSDWVEINVLDLATKEKLSDVINYVKFSGISWRGNGFYYSAYEPPKEGSDYSGKNEFHTVYYHTIGTKQSDDKLVYRDDKNPQRNAGAGVTEDENFLIITTSESTNGNSLALQDVKKGGPLVKLVENYETDNYIIDHLGEGKFLVFTNYNAPNNAIMMVDINKPKQEQWTAFIPEKEYVLSGASIIGDKIIATYMKNVQSKIEVYDLAGKYLYDIELPGIGIASLNGDKDENTAFYSFTSYTIPTTIYKYDVANNTSEVYFKPETKFNSDEYETKQVFVTSKDGEQVPMFITHKKGLQLDGTNPTFLYGYGGFNISITPRFSVVNTVFLEQGGIYAVVNLRGGSEFGEDWHKAGWRMNKQNVFNDFIAAAEYMIANKYTSSEKLAIHGRSNGGLLAGAVMTQRPDLMKVSIPGVGVLDMLRYHKFTIGWAWAGEYGDSEESEESFKNLLSYSPLHNVKEGVEYPATMVVTADHDDRVVPAHSFKFISELQAKHTGDNPVLIRVDVNAGHGAGKPTEKVIEEWADVWSFVLWNTKAEVSFEKEVE